jgi:hypothetical protein
VRRTLVGKIMTEPRKLRVFLCHASQDKPVVRELYQRLLAEGWIDPWLDEEKIFLGQDWDMEIEKVVRNSDAVIIFLSNNSITKEGYVQKELRIVLDVAQYKPEGAIFIIPLLIEKCSIPMRLRGYHYQNYFNNVDLAYIRLYTSLEEQAKIKEIDILEIKENLRRQQEEIIRQESIARIGRDAAERIRRDEFNILTEQAEKLARQKIENELLAEAEERLRKAVTKKKRADILAFIFPKFLKTIRNLAILCIFVAVLFGVSRSIAMWLPLKPQITTPTAGDHYLPTSIESTIQISTLAPESTITPTETATLRPIPTLTSISIILGIVTENSVNVRSGPGLIYPGIIKYNKGTELTILGQNHDGTWLVVLLPNGSQGWISAVYVYANFSTSDLDVVAAPPTPIITLAPLIKENNNNSNNCQQYTNTINSMQSAYGSSIGDPNYDPSLDLNGDGTINVVDIGIVTDNIPPECN